MFTNPQSLPVADAFILRVHMESDWHIGQGAGRPGDVDRLVQRDADGLPWLPAKSLTGILRDACERVALGLDDGKPTGHFSQWVTYIFGEQPSLSKAARLEPPRAAALSVRAARFPEAFRSAVSARPFIKEALTFVKVGVEIDPASGGAKEKHLHFDEVVRGGSVLEANCRLVLPPSENQQKLMLALLLAGASQVERLGGKRRRGNGKCRIEIVSTEGPLPSRDVWVGWLEAACTSELSLPGCAVLTLPGSPPSLPICFDANNHAPHDGWMALDVTLRAETPLVIPSHTVGNVVETLDYVPGTYLLPLVSRLLGSAHLSPLAVLSRGDVIVTHATPEVGTQRGLPVPLALFHEKGKQGLGDGRHVWNRLAEPDPSREPSGSHFAPLRNHRVGWITDANTQLPDYAHVHRSNLMHNTIDDGHQRPTAAVGGLYSYEAMAEGTVLRAEVRVRCSIVQQLKAHRSDWWNALAEPAGELLLGRSQKDEYGRVRITVASKPRLLTPAHSDARRIILWLQSHLLIRDEYLRPSADPRLLVSALSRRLNVPLRMVEQGPALHDALLKPARVDSWQTRWGLPRPSLIGISAGSCLILEADTPVPGSALATLELEGLGERRAEGYGQVSINVPLLQRSTSSLVRSVSPEAKSNQEMTLLSPGTTETRHLSYARMLERCALSAAIMRKAQSRAADATLRQDVLSISLEGGTSRPSLSQIGALRSRIRTLRSPEGQAQLRHWLEKVTNEKRIKKRGIEAVAHKLKVLLDEPQKVWAYLGLDALEPFVMTEGGAAQLSEEFCAEAIQTLVAAMITQHKRAVEKATGRGQHHE